MQNGIVLEDNKERFGTIKSLRNRFGTIKYGIHRQYKLCSVDNLSSIRSTELKLIQRIISQLRIIAFTQFYLIFLSS